MHRQFVLLAALLSLSACVTATRHDIVIRNGTIYDGSGRDPMHGDLAIDGDRIAAVGTVQGRGRTEIDAHGLAVSPGFINVMSQSTESLMDDGGFGIASALIYAPGAYAKTDELIELSKVAGERGGMYISHMRSEGDHLLEAVDELIAISREAKLPAEIYHLKAAGVKNWPKMDEVIARVNAARANGQRVTADMYTYTA